MSPAILSHVDGFNLSIDQAEALARLPMSCIQREYPNAPGLQLKGPEDLKTPRELHPAFYGCLDWHSAVHGHWMLIRLLKLFDLPAAPEIRRVLSEQLTSENLLVEAEYLRNRPSFERTYGWAWLLKLVEELHHSGAPEAKDWRENLRPLEEAVVQGYLDFLPKQTYPIRVGTHGNTAFGLAFALDYACTVGSEPLDRLIRSRSLDYYLNDPPATVAFEPGGNDFFSPALMEADLMRRVLNPDEFRVWFSGFMPDLSRFREPAIVTDRSDGQLAHLDGLNLTRAWCLKSLGSSLNDESLLEMARIHAKAGLDNVATGHYEGEHWLASFAVYLQSSS